MAPENGNPVLPDWGDIFSGVCSALLQYGHFLTSCGSLMACLRASDVAQGLGIRVRSDQLIGQ